MKKFVSVFIVVLILFVFTACPTDPVIYLIGDTGPAGGLIFYIDVANEFSWDYLEAASVSTEWGSTLWSTNTYSVESETGNIIGDGIGDGIDNTKFIIEWLLSESETGKAAQLCDNLTESGYSDWFLPSKAELNLMYLNLHVPGLGGFNSSSYYWSSSEYSGDYAWEQYFGDGMQYEDDKGTGEFVRAARAF